MPTTIQPKFKPGIGDVIGDGGAHGGTPPATTNAEVRDAQKTLLATVTLSATGIDAIVLEDAAPQSLTALLDVIARRGILVQIDPDAPPPGYRYEPVSAWNQGRLADAIQAWKEANP